MTAHIRATGTAEMMRYDDKIKQWIQHLDVNEPATVQVVHDQSTQTFVLVISIFQNKCHRIVMKQQIYHNLKYQTNNNNQFHQWRDESRTVYGLSFTDEQDAMNIHHAVREAQNFLNELIKAEHVNGANGVYQDPQNHYYVTPHQTNMAKHHQAQQQPSQEYMDRDSLGSNGYNRKQSYAAHSQITTGQTASHHHQQQAALQQQNRRASQGSSGSTSTVSGNIYASAQLNGYNNNGNAVSATANGPSQALINQIQQQPIRLNNSHLNGSTQLNGSGQVNGHHHTQQQHPIRTPVPPAPPMMHQPAQISANVPPPPPPPPALNGPTLAKPDNIRKASNPDKPLTMAEQLQQKQLKKTAEQNGAPETTTTSNNPPRPKPSQAPSMDLMSELNNKLRKRQNQEEIISVASAASTSSTVSTNSSESADKKDPPPPVPKIWTRPANNLVNGTQNGSHHGNINGLDSPKVNKKQFSASSGPTLQGEDLSTIMCTKADLERLKEEVFTAIGSLKLEILEAIKKR